MEKYDFSGWATRVNLKCSDGRTIMKDAFKHNDGKTVPLVWNHQHNDPLNVLGHALLENREEGVYAYCSFNDGESGQAAKELVMHKDISALSIYANQLKQDRGNVLHGSIREVSLVLAGANPGAYIDSIISHGEESDEEAIIYTGENIELHHADEVNNESSNVIEENNESSSTDEVNNESSDVVEENKELQHADNDNKETNKEGETKTMAEEAKTKTEEGEETVQEVWDTLSEKQKTVVYAMIGQALEENNDEGEEKEMKQNVFEKDNEMNTLSHADQAKIIADAKSNNVGSLRAAMDKYAAENALAHGFNEDEMTEYLFPEYKDVKPGAPDLLTNDLGWVNVVLQKAHKSPISRIRTRQADARIAELRAKGFKKGQEKAVSGNIKLLGRTTDPQTIYRKDALNRDDILDITDFDVVAYQYGVMRQNLNEEIALAVMIGDGREDGEPDKIEEVHVRSIWHDDELYTIHTDIDIEGTKNELQGSNTGANFGTNFIYAESVINAALYSREKFKGSGTPDFYCSPHLLNIMLLARDISGHRMYQSKSDLAAALNVGNIYTAEQFEGKTRTTKDGKEKKLLGIFVNLADYQIGATKGGEITKFNQFDIDFNQEKYLIETRISGALTKVYSAIALEEPVSAE